MNFIELTQDPSDASIFILIDAVDSIRTVKRCLTGSDRRIEASCLRVNGVEVFVRETPEEIWR
jgi:hypothetical protein